MEDVEKRVIGKVMWRLIPFLIVCYFVAYLDRVNVGFAKLHMNQALGLSDAAFGLGAGLFFIGYFLFEVPSNIFLEKVGARVWIARIMITWGIVSAAFAFIPWISASDRSADEGVFYSLRLLLGACEAGFFPGIIFYLTLWFPAVYRARVISLFMLAIPISSIIGSPISGLAARGDGLGAGGLAMALHHGGVAVGSGRHRRPDLSDRFPAPGALAATGRDRLARERTGHREEKQGEGRAAILEAGADGSAHSAVRAGVFLSQCRKLWRGLLSADHHQELWRQRHPDRIARRAALCVRRHRHGAARPPFRPDYGTKRPRRRGVADGDVRNRIVRPRFQSGHRDGAALLCTNRRLRGAADVLAAAGELPDGRIGCRRASPRSIRSETFPVSPVLTRWVI